jgi:hypothetical protein
MTFPPTYGFQETGAPNAATDPDSRTGKSSLLSGYSGI